MKNIQPFSLRHYERWWDNMTAYANFGFMHQPDTEAEESVQAESLAVEREAQEDFNEENRE